ncbi:WD repeat-containing protein 43 [Culicoides brevitarsis]|uniref:WD repeat-containing protein 43 n=1 Tax=Culicoides brevitarsis TaxID=469753 RepID=UPI00307B8ABA
MQEDLNHVMEFSSDGKFFAYIDEAGKLKIWDTEKNQLRQEYVPNLHLASPITCLKWIEVARSTKKTPKKKQKKEDLKFYLVLGTSSGKVVLYSFAEGQIEREFTGNGHSDAVTDLFYDDGEFIYSCGNDAKVVKWTLADGGKEVQAFQAGKQKLTAIAVIENFVIVAARGIKVWNLATETCEKSFTGHSGVVTLLKTFTHDGKNYFLSVSRTERIVSMWCLEAEGENSVGSFVTDDSVVQISLNVFNETLKLTAVNRVGVVHYYVQDMQKMKTAKPVKKRLNLQIVSEAVNNVSEPIPVVACVMGHGDNELLVAYGDRMLLKFEHVQPDQSLKENILIRQNPKKFKKQSELDAQKPHNTVVPIVEKGQVEYLNQVTASRKDLKPIDTPLATRLENLSMGKVGEPQPKNMARLLIQGLHSKDANILRTVFQTSDVEGIRTTLSKLPPQYIKPLVHELSLLMQMKTVHVQSSVIWLKTLIQTQMSQLMALGSDNLKDIFGTCLGIIDHRLFDLPALMMLNGRMDLIATQLTNKSNKDMDNEIDLSQMLVFEDKSDDEENLHLGEESDDGNLNWDDDSEEEDVADEEMGEEGDENVRRALKDSSEDESESEMDTD